MKKTLLTLVWFAVGTKMLRVPLIMLITQVDYSTTPEELQQLFQSCGTVNRITILTDKFENPKGYDCVSHVQFKLYEFGFPRLFLAGATLTANTGPILSSPLCKCCRKVMWFLPICWT